MKLRYGALVFFLLACSVQAGAQDSRCDADERVVVTSLDELPAQVLELLGRANPGTLGIADIGGRFNPSDVVIANSVPMRRLVKGLADRHCIWLTVEYGGVGHYQKTLEYSVSENSWAQVKDANSGHAPGIPPATR